MSNYVKAVDFSAKDGLASGNPNKIIKGTEINDEFNAIATAVGTKADLASPAFLGNPSATTQPLGNNSTRLATTAFVQAALQALHPIGSIYISILPTNPNILFGFGTWVAFATGKTIFGFDSSNVAFDTVEETGGSADAVVVSHTHTTTITDSGHNHIEGFSSVGANAGGAYGEVSGASGAVLTSGAFFGNSTAEHNLTSTSPTGITVVNNPTGVSGVNANLPPYITVFMWKRTA